MVVVVLPLLPAAEGVEGMFWVLDLKCCVCVQKGVC